MRIELSARPGLTSIVSAALLTFSAWAYASEPKPRPTPLDPSNSAAPGSPKLGLSTLGWPADAPPAPAARHSDTGNDAPAAPKSAAEHGHEHGGNATPSDKDKSGGAEKPKATVYTCPMHPEVAADKPGRCPKCGMKLVPKEPAEGKK